MWQVRALGDASGRISSTDLIEDVDHDKTVAADLQEGLLSCDKGKISDSLDSFIYWYEKIDPSTTDFSLEAYLTPEYESVPDRQCGFGIMVCDTDMGGSDSCGRNYLLAGMFDRKHLFGVRVVHGYTDVKARDNGLFRKMDQSRLCRKSHDPGNRIFVKVTKDGSGFAVQIDDEKFTVKGHDLLMKQSNDICIGFAVSRKMTIRIESPMFDKGPGKAVATPDREFGDWLSEYPFPRALLENRKTAPRQKIEATIDDTPSLVEAVRNAGPGSTIILKEGIYEPEETLIATYDSSSHPLYPVILKSHGKAIISGKRLRDDEQLFILAADNWHISGISFCDSPASGIVICGNGNRIEECEAYGNRDTGILICSCPGDPYEDWPSCNRISGCICHDNCDASDQADGFGAKLRIGEGNLFQRCLAYHNGDDGFDLYTKAIYGSIGKVTLEECIAYENGKAEDGRINEQACGFKLGGERQKAGHRLERCVSFDNPNFGFSANSSSGAVLHRCIAWGNKRSDLSQDGDGLDLHDVITGKEDASFDKSDPFAYFTGTLKAKRKRILFMIPSLGGGGAERVTCRLATLLSKRHDVYLMYFNADKIPYPLSDDVTLVDGDLGYRFRFKGGPLRKLEHRLLRLKEAGMVTAFKKEKKIDVCISMLQKPDILNALSPGSFKIMSERNDPYRKAYSYGSRESFRFLFADRVVFQSKDARSYFNRHIQKKGVLIRNPVEVDIAARNERKKKVVTAGRLVRQKDHLTLIESFARFHEHDPEYELYIYGNGPLKKDLEEKIKQLGLEGCAFIRPFTLDLHEQIADAQFFVLSSLYEGLSNALLEAMAMGLAVISMDCLGSSEIIRDGHNGLLVPIGDADALKEAMIRLADDERLRKKLQINGLKATYGLMPEMICRQWEELFL